MSMGLNWGNGRTHRKLQKPDFADQNCPPGDTVTRTHVPSRDRPGLTARTPRWLPHSKLFKLTGYIALFSSFIHSLTQFNLSVTGAFYATHTSRALQSCDQSGEGINFGSHTYFIGYTDMEGLPGCDQFNAGATYEKTRSLKAIHTIHSLIPSNKAKLIRMMMMAKLYSGTLGA